MSTIEIFRFQLEVRVAIYWSRDRAQSRSDRPFHMRDVTRMIYSPPLYLEALVQYDRPR